MDLCAPPLLEHLFSILWGITCLCLEGAADALPSLVGAAGAVTSPTLLTFCLGERRQGADSCQITGWGKPALREESRKEKLMVETTQAKLFFSCHSTSFCQRGRTPPCPAPAHGGGTWKVER